MKTRFISGRIAVFLVLLSALSLLGLLVLFAYAPEMRATNSSGNDAVSRSSVGFAGLLELLTLSGVPAELDRGPGGGSNHKPSLTILTPEATTSTRELKDYERNGPVLVILPKWEVVPIPLKSEWVVKRGAIRQGAIADLVKAFATDVTIARFPGNARQVTLTRTGTLPANIPAVPLATIDAIQTIGGAQSILTARNYGPLLSVVYPGGYPVYVLSEPDLMNNHGLSDAATADTALAIIRALRNGDGPVTIDVKLNGLGRSPSLLRAFFEPPFLGATICALVAALLMGLHIASRFGPPLQAGRVFARGKRALADNTADLVRVMGREAAMARGYVLSARNLALTRLGAQHASVSEQDALLATIERSSDLPEAFAALSAEAMAAKGAGDLIRIARKTYIWRRGVTGGY